MCSVTLRCELPQLVIWPHLACTCKSRFRTHFRTHLGAKRTRSRLRQRCDKSDPSVHRGAAWRGGRRTAPANRSNYTEESRHGALGLREPRRPRGAGLRLLRAGLAPARGLLHLGPPPGPAAPPGAEGSAAGSVRPALPKDARRDQPRAAPAPHPRLAPAGSRPAAPATACTPRTWGPAAGAWPAASSGRRPPSRGPGTTPGSAGSSAGQRGTRGSARGAPREEGARAPGRRSACWEP